MRKFQPDDYLALFIIAVSVVTVLVNILAVL